MSLFAARTDAGKPVGLMDEFGEAALGLSCAHISSHKEKRVTVEIAKGATFSRFTGDTVDDASRLRLDDDGELRWKRRGGGGGGRRGKVKGFSRASRRRMLEFVNCIDGSKVEATFWVSMTCPDLTWDTVERARRKWVDRMQRRWGMPFSILWRKEPHESGVPHLHALIFFTDGVPHLVNEFRPWNDQAWAESCGRPDIARTCCNVKLIRKWAGAGYYAAKYCAKGSDGGTGRQWGVVNREHLPIEMQSESITVPASVKAKRVLRKAASRRAEKWEVKGADSGGRWIPKRDGLKLTCERAFAHVTFPDQRAREAFFESIRESELLDLGGWRQRRRRPTFMRRVQSIVYGASTPGGFESPVWTEPVHVTTGRFFFRDDTVRRVLRWAADDVVADLLDAEGLPF